MEAIPSHNVHRGKRKRRENWISAPMMLEMIETGLLLIRNYLQKIILIFYIIFKLGEAKESN
jgi:hypothetical protein